MKIDPRDIKQSIKFAKPLIEERYPLELKMIQRILEIAKPAKRALYLCLLSSGARIGEILQVRKRDVDTTGTRPVIHLSKHNKNKSS